jgi:hypothetical protein
MSFSHVVVDGSNIATEGRSVPSLAQLDEAVQEFQREYPGAEITVVVDATFGHRIDPSERQAYEDAQAHGELVSPPAGAIGRGDAFLLRIADKSGATVFSNDSFQEFHGEYEWLFAKSRLMGGKPVPGVGWIFTPRTPVRGPKSRESVRDAKRSQVRVGSVEASQPMPVPKTPPPGRAPAKAGGRSSRGGARARGREREEAVFEEPSSVEEAIATATEEVVAPSSGSSRRRRRRGSGPSPEAVNEPLAFITFIAEHPLGSELVGEVESFSSHGAFVMVGDARCYLPLSGMGDPPPRSGRQVLTRGEQRTFVLQALDPQRRGIEVAMPGFAHVSGAPLQETVDAEIERTGGSRRRGRSRSGADLEASPGEVGSQAAPAKKAGARKAVAKKSVAKKTASKKAAADTATAVTAAPTEVPAQEVPAQKVPAQRAPAKRATVAKARVAKVPANKVLVSKVSAGKVSAGKVSAGKAVAKKVSTVAKVPASKAVAKKAPANQAPAVKVPATKVGASKALAKKVAGSKVPASKVAGSKVAASKALATKAPAKKTPATNAAAKKAAPAMPGVKKVASSAKGAPVTKPATKKATAKKSPAKATPRRQGSQ